MDEKLRQTYLFDFYGELLNPHQRRLYEDYCSNDLTISEIAVEEGISRQAVAEMIKRCRAKLEGYESKLHLLERFLSVRTKVGSMRSLAQGMTDDPAACAVLAEQMIAILDQILEEL